MADWKLINSINGIYNISVKSLDEQVNDNPSVTTTGGFASSTNTLQDQNGNTVFLLESFKESQTDSLNIDVMRRTFIIVWEKDVRPSPRMFKFFAPYFYDSSILNPELYSYWCKAFTDINIAEELYIEYAIKVSTFGKNIGNIEIYSNIKYIPGSIFIKQSCDILKKTDLKDFFAEFGDSESIYEIGGTNVIIKGDTGSDVVLIGREGTLGNINLFEYIFRFPESFGNGTSAGNDNSVLSFGILFGDSTTNAYGQLIEVRGCKNDTRLAGFSVDYDTNSINNIYGKLLYTRVENTNTIFSLKIPLVAFSLSIDELVKTTSDDSTDRVFGKTSLHISSSSDEANSYASYRVIVKYDCSGSTATSFGTIAIYSPLYGRYVVSINSLYGSLYPLNIGDETLGPILTYQDIGAPPPIYATYVRIIRGVDYYTAEFY
jgi:hypothetical protein